MITVIIHLRVVHLLFLVTNIKLLLFYDIYYFSQNVVWNDYSYYFPFSYRNALNDL